MQPQYLSHVIIFAQTNRNVELFVWVLFSGFDFKSQINTNVIIVSCQNHKRENLPLAFEKMYF